MLYLLQCSQGILWCFVIGSSYFLLLHKAKERKKKIHDQVYKYNSNTISSSIKVCGIKSLSKNLSKLTHGAWIISNFIRTVLKSMHMHTTNWYGKVEYLRAQTWALSFRRENACCLKFIVYHLYDPEIVTLGLADKD